MAVRSLLGLQEHLLALGHTVVFDLVANGSILPKVRNGIVKRFLDKQADVLIFLDSDMVYEPQDIAKLINAPFDVSVISYRSKQNAITFLAEACREDGEVLGVSLHGDFWLQTNRAGTGVMAIKRETILEMIQAFPHLQYEDKGERIPCLFDFVLSDGKYHGEDYTFCQRLIEAGGQIFILADAFVGHIGDTVYTGNYHEYLGGLQ